MKQTKTIERGREQDLIKFKQFQNLGDVDSRKAIDHLRQFFHDLENLARHFCRSDFSLSDRNHRQLFCMSQRSRNFSSHLQRQHLRIQSEKENHAYHLQSAFEDRSPTQTMSSFV